MKRSASTQYQSRVTRFVIYLVPLTHSFAKYNTQFVLELVSFFLHEINGSISIKLSRYINGALS